VLVVEDKLQQTHQPRRIRRLDAMLSKEAIIMEAFL